ncbi:MAG: adenylate/guanylate cyclase domain-containing protein [Hyphomicrobiaceae bacterium]
MARSTTRRLAAIVAADVAGYSRLMGIDDQGTLAALQEHRRELLDPQIVQYSGRIVKTTGDGLLLEFSSIINAVRFCLVVQCAMLVRNKDIPPERRMQFRIGVNLGDVIVDGDDVFGDGVNIAARLEALADAGGICISQVVLDQVKQRLALDVEELGNTALKNIEEPIRSYRVVGQRKTETPKAANEPTSSLTDSGIRLPERPSVAIMPFRNMNGNVENDYIPNAIGLGIQTLLVQLSGLFLINASAHQGYKDGTVNAADAVRDLPIRYVLEGTVEQIGAQVKVTTQLTDLQNDSVIWAGRYERNLEDVFLLQDDVTREVTSALGGELLGTTLDRVWTRGLKGRGAWEYFLRGVSHFYKLTKHDNAAARAMFEKIHELLPEKTIGPAYIAVTHWFDAVRGWSDSSIASLGLARDWAEASIEPATENNGLGYVVLGSIRLRDGQHDDALALCRKGVALRANCPFSLGQLADAQLHCGDAHGAVKTARDALSVRMIYLPPLINVLAVAYRDSGSIDLSIPAAREAARLDPQHADAFVTLCTDYVLAGCNEDAYRVSSQIMELDPEFRISTYTDNLPYSDNTTISNIAETLRLAGLPE